MIFKIRDIKKQFDTIHDFKLKNLIISGSSFAYNNSETTAVAWPYYLRDVGGFERVLDTSLPGAGNQHISNSLQWAIENDQPDPIESLIVIQWSHDTYDDYICPKSIINDYPFKFNYSDNVMSGITGGIGGGGNTKKDLTALADTKTLESRAIENYLHISGLFNFLTSQHYKFIFLPNPAKIFLKGSANCKIEDFLPKHIKNKLNQMYIPITSIAEWAIKYNFLDYDQYHSVPDGHLDWTQKVLLPKLQSIIT